MSTDGTMIGVGIYSVSEAARLSGVAAARIRRWVRGYTFRAGETTRRSEPVWQSQLPLVDHELAIGFLDLIEVRLIDAFLNRGVTWPVIRRAEARASEIFGTTHPFATKGFRTDGRRIFADVIDAEGLASLLDLADSQLAFRKVVAPSLVGVEFRQNTAVRWWPLGAKRRVVVDPRRSFGQPIVNREGVPTAILAQAFAAEGTEQAVAKWYQVDVRAVRDAVEFEKRLAA